MMKHHKSCQVIFNMTKQQWQEHCFPYPTPIFSNRVIIIENFL